MTAAAARARARGLRAAIAAAAPPPYCGAPPPAGLGPPRISRVSLAVWGSWPTTNDADRAMRGGPRSRAVLDHAHGAFAGALRKMAERDRAALAGLRAPLGMTVTLHRRGCDADGAGRVAKWAADVLFGARHDDPAALLVVQLQGSLADRVYTEPCAVVSVWEVERAAGVEVVDAGGAS